MYIPLFIYYSMIYNSQTKETTYAYPHMNR